MIDLRSSTLVLLALSGTGCAPGLPHLLATRQHGEAACAVARDPDPTRKRAVAATVIERAAPQIYLRAVSSQELERSLGPRATEIHRKFAVVIVALSANDLDVKSSFDVSFVGAGRTLPALPATADTFAAMTHETLPGARTVTDSEGRLAHWARTMTPGPEKSTAEAVGGTVAGLLEMATLGLVPFTSIFGKKPDTVTVIRPTEAERRKSAPFALALDDGVTSALSAVPPIWHPRALVLDRPVAPAVVRVHGSFTPYTNRGRCDFAITMDVPLPPAPSFEESVARAFPEGAVPVLARAPAMLD